MLKTTSSALCWACSAIMALALTVPQAWAGAPQITVSPHGTYVRVLFRWQQEAKAQASLANDVVVIRFEKPSAIDSASLEKQLGSLAALVRPDADGLGLRIALTKPARVNASQDGRLFAVDIIAPERKDNPAAIVDPKAEDVAPQPVLLRVSEQQTLTRLSFDWPHKVAYRTKLKEGKLTVSFDKAGAIDLARFNKAPPAWVRGARAEHAADGLRVVFDVDPEARMQDRMQGRRVTIDVLEPKMDGGQDVASAGSGEDAIEVPALPEFTADMETLPLPPRGAAQTPGTQPMVLTSASEKDPHAPAPKVEHSDAAAIAAETPASHAHAPAAADPVAAASALPTSLRAADTPSLGATAPEPANDTVAIPGLVKAEIYGANLKLTFPFKALPEAAIFRRGEALWLVFASEQPLDTGALEQVKGLAAALLTPPHLVEPGITALRIKAPQDMVASAEAAGQAWSVTLGPGVPNLPGQIPLLREVVAGGPSSLRAILRGAGKVIWLREPDSGSKLAVVLAHAPARGLRSARNFVEVQALPTLHGLTFLAAVDDLAVTSHTDHVLVSRPNGLVLSADARPEPSVALHASEDSGFVDFEAWGRAAAGDHSKAAQTLLRASAESTGGVSPQRIALARYFVSKGLGAEAIGVLNMIAREDGSVQGLPDYRLVRGIANLAMARYREAVEDLAIEGLVRDPHAAIFRGLAHAGLHQWKDARNNLSVAQRVMARYPKEWQARANLALAEAALNQDGPEEASRALALIPQGLHAPLSGRAALLRGRVAEQQGANELALSAFREAASSAQRSIVVRAELGLALLNVKLGKSKPEEAINALERLRSGWRGDEVERRAMHELGKLYLAQGKLREGLEVLRAATRYYPEAEETPVINTDMQKAFADLFLSGKSEKLSPVKALALFYDFKELTPVGVEGDEMIRKLADRLITVDLLDQAAELLQHQVDNRLDGIAKASIATRLSLVYLMARKPEKALNAIRATRQVRLPDDVIAQRRLIEARSLSDLKMSDEALDALSDDASAEAERLRADILWDAQRWREAGTKVEDILADAWKAGDPLTDADRRDVLRAAIAFTLANDAPALARVRERFGQKMTNTPDARSFTLVAQQADLGATDIRQLVAGVAAIDTLDGFLSEFRARYGGPGTPAAASN